MDACSRCNQKATLICECSLMLCLEDANLHQKEENDHSIRLLKPFIMSDLQRTSSKSLLSQLKVLDECSDLILKTSNLFIQETAKLARESLKKLQEKRAELLNDLKMTNKRIDDEEISKLQAISNEILTSQVPCSALIQEPLRKYFGTPLYKKQAKFQCANPDQAKK